MWFENISHWYKRGFWNEKMVQDAVIKEKITQEQADLIIKGE